MNKIERFLEKHAIKNLSVILILCYVMGYIIMYFFPASIIYYTTLDPYAIMHGQIWRLFTWIIIPSQSFDIFTVITLFLYYSIGTQLERTWGTYQYNKFIFGGIFFTVIGSFLFLIYSNIFYAQDLAYYGVENFYQAYSLFFTSYYVNMSIFLGFAMTYPESKIYLMFVLPIKIKWVGYAYAIMMAFNFILGGNNWASTAVLRFLIGCTFFNFILFYYLHRKKGKRTFAQKKSQVQYKVKVKKATPNKIHKCAVCGRTDVEFPELQFRFCSKCDGNLEYCQDHLFTHEHVKKEK